MSHKPAYVYVTPFFPSLENWRGAYGYDFINALKKVCRDIRVEVFVPGDGVDYEIFGVKVWRFKEKKLPSEIFPFLFRKANEKSFLSAVKRAGIELGDIVVCHGNTAMFAIYPLAIKKLYPKCKTLLHHHDLQSFGLNGGILRHCWLYNMYMFPVLRRLHEQIDGHVFISDMSRASFLSAPNTEWTDYTDYKRQMRFLPYRSTRIKKTLILHNGVDLCLFHPREIRKSNKTSVIGCIGNFERLKDQITLIKAIEKLSKESDLDLRVKFVGSGSTLRECKEYIVEHRLSGMFEFLPEVRHEELPELYSSIDLFVLPSYFEGFGCVYVEAYACKVPFIACEGQGIAEIIEPSERKFWLAKKRDPDDLAKKICSYFHNRKVQQINSTLDIEELIRKFIVEIEL